jgi:hypothetical protein
MRAAEIDSARNAGGISGNDSAVERDPDKHKIL